MSNHKRSILKGIFKAILFFVLPVFLIGGFIVFRKAKNRDAAFKLLKGEGEIIGELELINQIATDSPPIKIALIGSNLVMWYGDRITFTSSDGKVINDRKVNLNNAQASFGEKYVYIYDSGGKDIYILNEKGNEAKHIETEDELSVVFPVNDKFACVERTRTGERVRFASNDGVELYSDTVQNRHYSTVDSSNSNNYYAIGSFYSKANNIYSSFEVYDKDGKVLVQQGLDSEVVLAIDIDDSGQYSYLTNEDLYFGKIVEEKPTEEINLFDEVIADLKEKGSTEIVGLCYSKTIGVLTENRLYELDTDGELLMHHSFSGDYSNIQAFRNGFILTGTSGMKIIENGVQIIDYPGETLAVATGGKMLVIQSVEGIRWNKVKYLLE